MTSPDLQSPPETGQTHPGRRPLKTLFIILTLIILGLATLASIWTARRYQQAVELAKRTQEQYGTLNRQYPFEIPQAGEALPPERWQALLRAHEEVQRQAPARLRQRLEALLRARSLRDPALYRELLKGVPQFRELLDAQLDALRREQMSAREYQWMLGLGIVRVMESDARPPDGTRRVLERLQSLTHADADRGNDVDAQTVQEFLEGKYRGAASPAPEVLQALRGRDEASCAMDLMLTMIQWTAPEGKAPEGLLRKILPRH